MTRHASRLTARVILIALFVVVPALSVILSEQASDRRRAREQAVENTLALAHLAANQQAEAFRGVQRLLSTLALFRDFRDEDPAGCHALLPTGRRDHPRHINIFVVGRDGSSLCAA